MTRAFVAAIEQFARQNQIPMVTFEKGRRKDEVTAELRAKYPHREGVVFIGKAQEKCAVYRTEKRHNPKKNTSYAWIVKSTALVHQYYFYCIDDNFGPFFLKFCSYFPYNAKLCLNGHEYAEFDTPAWPGASQGLPGSFHNLGLSAKPNHRRPGGESGCPLPPSISLERVGVPCHH
jgi:hypothetical protein